MRDAVAQNGLNYLGFCAGAFFGGFSAYYNVVDLTSLVGTYISIGALLNVAEVKTETKDGPDYLPALQP